MARDAFVEEHASTPNPAIQLLLALAQTTADLVVLADVRGNILHLNPAGRHMLGIPPHEDVTALTLSDLHPAWANVIVLGEGVETALLDGSWRGETALIARSGREIAVTQIITAHTGTDRQCEFLSMIARDISDTKQVEEGLRKSERFYRSIVETANAGICIIDLDNRIRFANPSLARVLGYQVEELVGKPVTEFIVPESARAQAETRERRCFRFKHKEGGEFEGMLATSPLYDDDERYSGVLGVIM